MVEPFRGNSVNIKLKETDATEKVEQVIDAAEPTFPASRAERIRRGLPVEPCCMDRRAGIIAQHSEGVEMKTDHELHELDELIKAAWGVIEADFDPVAFQHWRLKAFECLTAMFGSDHVYTKHFEHFVRQGNRANALAAGGLLSAAKQQWAEKKPEPYKPLNDLGSASPVTGEAGDSTIRRDN